MKKLISKLQAQAYIDCETVEDGLVQTDEFMEKFAELIVTECLYIMENSVGDLDFAIYKIKQDFEVK
jgi:hypothetical protein